MTFRLPPEARTGGHPYRRSMHSTALIEPHSLAVETHGLGKRFGTRAALDGVDLEVPCGCAFGFLGANGAGKTTLIRLLLGLAEPTAGRMRLLGRDLPAQRAAALARVGLAARGDDRVKTYSLGMRQRLGVARCLLADPEHGGHPRPLHVGV